MRPRTTGCPIHSRRLVCLGCLVRTFHTVSRCDAVTPHAKPALASVARAVSDMWLRCADRGRSRWTAPVAARLTLPPSNRPHRSLRDRCGSRPGWSRLCPYGRGCHRGERGQVGQESDRCEWNAHKRTSLLVAHLPESSEKMEREKRQQDGDSHDHGPRGFARAEALTPTLLHMGPTDHQISSALRWRCA